MTVPIGRREPRRRRPAFAILIPITGSLFILLMAAWLLSQVIPCHSIHHNIFLGFNETLVPDGNYINNSMLNNLYYACLSAIILFIVIIVCLLSTLDGLNTERYWKRMPIAGLAKLLIFSLIVVFVFEQFSFFHIVVNEISDVLAISWHFLGFFGEIFLSLNHDGRGTGGQPKWDDLNPTLLLFLLSFALFVLAVCMIRAFFDSQRKEPKPAPLLENIGVSNQPAGKRRTVRTRKFSISIFIALKLALLGFVDRSESLTTIRIWYIKDRASLFIFALIFIWMFFLLLFIFVPYLGSNSLRGIVGCTFLNLMAPLDNSLDLPVFDWPVYGHSIGNLRSSLEDVSEHVMFFVFVVFLLIAITLGEIGFAARKGRYKRQQRKLNFLLQIASLAMVASIFVVHFYAELAAASWNQFNDVEMITNAENAARVVTTHFAILSVSILMGAFLYPMVVVHNAVIASGDEPPQKFHEQLGNALRQFLPLVSPLLAAEIVNTIPGLFE